MINTNGNTSFEMLKKCIDAGLDWLIFSVDSHSKETYEQIRIRGDYNIVKYNIESCLHYINKN
jgi:molybdenum cofactor biosynthesis enzyme MoaA